MTTLIVSQGNAGGAALLAASIRLWTEVEQVPDLHVICHRSTLPVAFWSKTVRWLLGESDEGPDVYRVHREGGRYHLKTTSLPASPTVILLRIPRNKEDVAGSTTALSRMAKYFGPLNVVEIADVTFPDCDPIDGVRTCRVSNPPLLSLRGAPPPDILELAWLSGAALHWNEALAFPYLQQALKLVMEVRNDIGDLLESLLNEGPACLNGPIPEWDSPPDTLREGDTLFFPLHEAAAASHNEPDTFLEHIVQSALATDESLEWGIAYAPVKSRPGRWKLVVVARYDPHAMRQSLNQRMAGCPTALASGLNPHRPHYAMHKLELADLRRMLTAVLPAFFPRLDSALRRGGLCQQDHNIARAALDWLDPGAVPLERADSSVSLQGDHPWTIRGSLSPAHPACVAAACLIASTPKQDSIRQFHDARLQQGLCRMWHNLKSQDLRELDSWLEGHDREIREFCKRFVEMWRQARMPLPQDFCYAGQQQDWDDLATLEREAAQIIEGAPPSNTLLEVIRRLHEGPDKTRGPGEERFFSLAPLLKSFHGECWSPTWAIGGIWEPPGSRRAECLMWGPEVTENVLRPLWSELQHHAGDAGFVRMHLSLTDRWAELAILTSGPGVGFGRLRRALHDRQGLRTAAETVWSYGGRVTWRCHDGWYRQDGPGCELLQDDDEGAAIIRVCVMGLPALQEAVSSNPRLIAVDVHDRPDVLLSPTAVSAPGRQAPCLVVGDGAADVPTVTLEAARRLVRELVGFQVVYRFPRLS